MTSPLESLAVELKTIIFEHLDLAYPPDFLAGLHLSSTCTQLRQLFAPILFSSLVLREHEASGRSVQALSLGTNARHVRKLHFQGVCSILNDGRQPDVNTVLDEHATDVLSHLGRFPNLEDLIIEFPFDADEWSDCFDMWQDIEDPTDVLARESSDAWRALMAKIFTAVAANENHGIRRLELRRIPPKEVSTYSSDAWHRFLSGFEDVCLSVRDNENPDYGIVHDPGFVDWAENLPVFFFDHLSGVREFGFRATNGSAMGGEEANCSLQFPIGLSPMQMPLLVSLHLEYVFVCDEVSAFVAARCSTLEKVTMECCFAGRDTVTLTWSHFFRRILAAKPKQLRLFEVEWSESDEQGRLEWGHLEREKFPGTKVFIYTWMMDKYGKICHDETGIEESVVKGEDLRAYEEIQEVVRRNRAR